MKTKPILTARATALGILSFIPVTLHAAIEYSVTDLGTLGGNTSYGFGINASGQVAGYAQTTGGSYDAGRWTGTTPTDLGTLGGSSSQGYGINASGQVAGISYTTTGDSSYHAVRWTGTTPADLGTLGGSYSYGYGINASGQVAGGSYLTGDSAQHAVRWTGTTPTDLGTLGGDSSHGFGINASGQVAGYSDTTGNSSYHAVRWTGTTPTDLGTLGGDSSQGYGINASGQVAGDAQTTGGDTHAVRWTGTTPTDLGTLGGPEVYSYGYGINDFGDVVGMSFTTDFAAFDPFLYTGGTMYDVNDLLLPGSGVTGLTFDASGTGIINDLGQIAASGTIGGEEHALLLSPIAAVPEPSTWTWGLVAVGAIALPRLRNRRNSVST